MVPKLLRGTLTSTNCRALGSLAEVAGPAIAPHLSHIFPPMLRLASQPEGSSPATAAAKDCLDKVCIPLSTLTGMKEQGNTVRAEEDSDRATLSGPACLPHSTDQGGFIC